MRLNIFLFLLLSAAVGCGTAGNTGEGPDTTPTPGTQLDLEPGLYQAFETDLDNQCGGEARGFKDGFEAEVEITGATVKIAGTRFVREGNALDGPSESSVHDYRLTRQKDCVVRETIEWRAELTGDNAFDLFLEQRFEVQSGEECTPEVAGVDAPCATVASARFEPIELD